MSEKERRKVDRHNKSGTLAILAAIACVVGIITGNVLTEKGVLPGAQECDWQICEWLTGN